MTSISTVSSPSVQVAGPRDGKYRKRRKQRQEQRMRQAFAMMALAMVVLIYTWYSLLDVPEDSQPNPAMKASIFRTRQHLGVDGSRSSSEIQDRQPKRLARPRKTAKADQQGSDEESGGILGGVKSLFSKDERQKQLEAMLDELDEKIRENRNSGTRWVDPEFLPALKPSDERPLLEQLSRDERNNQNGFFGLNPGSFFRVSRKRYGPLAWEKEATPGRVGPKVDYTKHAYVYPPKLTEPPELGEYPKLIPFKELMERWPQDDLDNPPTPHHETLMHFDFNSPSDVEAAVKFREARLPFKFVNVPEVVAAG
eukprot:CAMPEP_0117004370 /NCGR_PEP_ID=MMETSP0472-20121206/5367_1 /TAXON_ID=693140 ORGANISM="Tiarina fusus, Strain LIS" /NCGR_SAMPLE_ID=MMETSP0472 /ASSEMBLY_ACC=CAM_ASM_000603 /LENGTH=310 /DNA_ID=CAMNT_0004705305 /DNA_START=137 /DNA_END=1065 /DNA_ORIENTATION=-